MRLIQVHPFPVCLFSREHRIQRVDDKWLLFILHIHRLQPITPHKLVNLVQKRPRVDVGILPVKVFDLLEANVEFGQVIIARSGGR